MKGIIDRFEGTMAVIELEGRITKNIPRNHLPAEAKEGDVIIEENGVFRIDTEETRRLQDDLRELTDGLWEK